MASICDIDRGIRFRTESAREPGVNAFWVNPLQDCRWWEFVVKHPAASVFHRLEWLQALKATYGYQPFVFTTTPPGKPLQNGIVLCEVRSLLTGNRLVSLPFSDHCEPLASCAEELDGLIGNLVSGVYNERWKYIELRSVCNSPSADTGLGLNATYYFHQLDLRPDEETLFKGFHKDSIQRKIARAEREGLRCEQGSSEELLKAFYQLLLKTRRRHGIPPQPRQWFRNLIATFGRDLNIRVAFKNETPVASILTILHNKTLVYKYGCSNKCYSNLGGTPLLFWHAIQEARANGVEVLDMGRSDLDNAGLLTFKERWGAKRTLIKYWRYPARQAESRLKAIVIRAKGLVARIPKCALVLLSNRFYRHIG